MRQPIAVLVPAVAFAVVAFSVCIDRSAQAADDCVARPKSTAPKGEHWYYRLDRVKHRQCWFLAAEGAHARKAAASPPQPSSTVDAPPLSDVPARQASASTSAAPTPAAPAPLGPMAAGSVAMPASAALDFSGRWPGPPRNAVASRRDPVSVGDGDTAENVVPARQEVMPPAAERATADTPALKPAALEPDPRGLSIRPGALLALLAAALALAGVLARVALNRLGRRRVARARAQRRPIWDTPDPWRRSAPPLAPRQAEVERKAPRAAAKPAPARLQPTRESPPLAPSVAEVSDREPAGDIERRLQQLLKNWQSRAA